MTGIETALLVAGTAMSAIGQIQQGRAAQQASNYNAAVARNNAIGSRQAAAENEKRERRLGLKRMGAMRARGASMDLLEDSAMEEELSALSIRHHGELQALGLEASANLEEARGRAAMQAGRVGAATSVLLGGAKATKGMSFGGSGYSTVDTTTGRSMASSLEPGGVQGMYE